jgi:ABC-type sugar transport system ATPase subunit
MQVRLSEVSVAYPGTLALDRVSFEFGGGEIIAVVGANGSGKTTLLSTLCGVRPASSGQLTVDGAPVRFSKPSHALALGITMVPQEPQLADTLPAWENVLLGSTHLLGAAPTRSVRAAAVETVRRGLPHIDPFQTAGSLRKADRAVLGLLRALHRTPRVLALDEPTAVLGENSIQVVEAAARQVGAAGGATVLVSHRLRDIVQLATRVIVLVDGRVAHDSPIDAVSVEDLVDRIAAGRRPSDAALFQADDASSGDTAAVRQDNTLRLGSIRSSDGLVIDDMEIRPGQILGVAGLAGSGRSRLCRVIAGHRTYKGNISLGGAPLAHGPRRRWRSGIAYLPEERVREALFQTLSVASNLEVGDLVWKSLAGATRPSPSRSRSTRLIDRFAIRTPGPDALITALSGGNQQRVVLARVLSHRPRVLIADEPTQGVDRTGRVAIHAMIRQFAATGGAVLMVSSEFEELQALATDIAVMVDGRIVARRPPTTQYRELVALATGSNDRADLADIDLSPLTDPPAAPTTGARIASVDQPSEDEDMETHPGEG